MLSRLNTYRFDVSTSLRFRLQLSPAALVYGSHFDGSAPGVERVKQRSDKGHMHGRGGV